MAKIRPPSVPAYVEALQGKGRYTFTREEAAESTERSLAAVGSALGRLRRRGRLASPRRGFYAIVPVEYREAGCPPATWFIDSLMAFLEQPYYVGLLSAAALHGAAHQQPMLFQVITDRPTRRAEAGRVRISFHMSRSVKAVPVMRIQTETGEIPVSTPEVTGFDLVRFAPVAGHLSHVATVLSELAERMDPSAMGDASTSYSTPDVQRLGYVLDLLGERTLASAVLDALRDRRVRPVKLAPKRPAERETSDAKWRVIPNASVDVDL